MMQVGKAFANLAGSSNVNDTHHNVTCWTNVASPLQPALLSNRCRLTQERQDLRQNELNSLRMTR